MRTSTVEYKIEAVLIDKDLAAAAQQARAALAAAEKALIDAYVKSDRYKALHDLAGFGSSAFGKSPVFPRIEGTRIVCRVMVDLPDETTGPQLYLDPKTANLLLGGKLLTDAEKRTLLKRMGVDFANEAEAAE
jgi:hypothetical protein